MKFIAAFLAILLILLQYRFWFGAGNVRELARLQQRIDELSQEIGRQREVNRSLQAEVADLKQGSEAVEERARYDLGMIKKGETFIQVVEP